MICFGGIFITEQFSEVIVPQIWEKETFADKISNETKNQMWIFKDRGNRDVTLIPEVTGIIQEMYDNVWVKSKKKPLKIFYVSKCYRYEKPQTARYREFTQFGLEILGDTTGNDYTLAKETLKKCLDLSRVSYTFNEQVERALGYYTDYGFEAICDNLGAQKQVAGGGRYKQGIGWAIGIDRLLLSTNM